jgi:hypothetical protein
MTNRGVMQRFYLSALTYAIQSYMMRVPLRKRALKDHLSLRKQGNLADMFEVINGKCRKKEKEENKQAQI